MNKQEIVTVLSELHKITGFRISLHGADYREIAAYPEAPLPFCAAVNAIREEHARCEECDSIACVRALESRATHIYKCRYGLTEAVSPLYNFGTLTGFLMMGQVARDEGEAKRAAELMLRLTKEGSADSWASKIPLVRGDLLDSYFKIMTICAQYLTLSGAMPSRGKSYAEEAKKYVRENLSRKISVSDICESLGCSKSTLLTSFRKKYGVTLGSYVTECRLKAAAELLLEGKKSINEISEETGFSDQSYFSKVFSAHFGVSPSGYRAHHPDIN